jgi:hypothetical protein
VRRVLLPPPIAILLLLGVALNSRLVAQHNESEAAFERIPFEQWLKERDQLGIRWTEHVSRAQLSTQQRLHAEVEVEIDGADLEKRRGRGQLVVFIQVNDQEGRRYRSHGTIDLQKMKEGVRHEYVTFTHGAFFLPGTYHLAVALLDTETKEHGVKQEVFQIPAFKSDPFPDAWRNLPPVEFVPPGDPPEGWHLPLTGRLHFPVTTERSAEIDVVINQTPSEYGAGSKGLRNRNLSVLIPALQVISQVDFQNSRLNVELLDLSRRRVTFRQNKVKSLDWSKLSDSLAETPAGTIDVKSLEHRHEGAAFFVAEIKRRIETAPDSHQARVLIVLSGPMVFESGEDLQPIRVESGTDCRVFYIRYYAPPVRPANLNMERAGFPHQRGLGPRGNGPFPQTVASEADQLGPTLKPLSPRIFDVRSPEQFRKALSTILTGISTM